MRLRLNLILVLALAAFSATAGPLLPTSDLGLNKLISLDPSSSFHVFTADSTGGAFSGKVNGTDPAWFFCVDQNDHIYGSDYFNANIVLLNSGFWNGSGQSGFVTKGLNSSWDYSGTQSLLTPQQRYEMAAYMVSQYGSASYSDTVIQDTIWALLFPVSAGPLSGNTDANKSDALVLEAYNFMNNPANSSFFSQWAVVSGNVDSRGALSGTTYQTFLVQVDGGKTPEPATFALLGAGLVSLGLIRRYRTRR